MLIVARRELARLLLSPFAWLMFAISEFLLAWWFFVLVDQFRLQYQPILVKVNSALGVTDLLLAPFFAGIPLIVMLILVVSLLSMRLIAEERHAGSLALLLASPISATQVVLGKYLGGLVFLFVAILLWCLLPLTLWWGSAPDLERFAAACLGLVLLGALLLAAATYISTLTKQGGVAAAVSFGFGMLLLLLENNGAKGGGLLSYLSVLPHYEHMLRGIVGTADLAYFGLAVLAFLAFAVRRVDALRIQG